MLIDDIDGSDADETIQFGLDGVSYEIDLNAAHAKELRDAMAKWVDAGRRTAGRRNARGGRRPRNDGAMIRKWAKENGYTIGDRGVIPKSIREAYAAAH